MAQIAEDDPSAFDLLLCCPSPVSRSQLLVDFSSVYDRQPHPDPQLEQAIERVWKERIAAQPSLFSATKFRYAGFEEIWAEGTKDLKNVILRLGLTDYKTFIGTNMSPHWKNFLGSTTGDVDRCRYTASPLGNAAIVETTDHHILILKRSFDVGEFPGYTVFPGGHSEPDDVGIKSHLIKQAANMGELNNLIATEMFDGIIREVVEETGVPSSTLSDPLFIGISRRRVNVRPTVFFYMKCTLTSQEVLSMYKHAAHSFESTVLHACAQDALPKAAKAMPGCHHGGAVIYGQVQYACQDAAQLPLLQTSET